jgi:glycosidase
LAKGQPHYFFSNHDQPRQWDRYGDGVHNDQIAKLMAALLLTPRVTPLSSTMGCECHGSYPFHHPRVRSLYRSGSLKGLGNEVGCGKSSKYIFSSGVHT